MHTQLSGPTSDAHLDGPYAPCNLPPEFFEAFRSWLGPTGQRFFRHCYGLTGTVSPVLKLNVVKRHIPSHPVHFREGMQVRNYLRTRAEFSGASAQDLDDVWGSVVMFALGLGSCKEEVESGSEENG